MIQMQSEVVVADNSGARSVMCIKGWRSHRRYLAWVTSSRSPQGRCSRAAVGKRRHYNAVGGSHCKGVRRPDGSLVRFDGNAAVLLNNKLEPSDPAFRAGYP